MGEDIDIRIKTTGARQSETEVRGVDNALDGLDDRAKKAGSSMKEMFTAMFGANLAYDAVRGGLRAIKNELVDSIRLGSEYAETHSKLNVIFGDVSGTVGILTDSYGMSNLQAEKLLGNTGDLLTGLGMQKDVALDLSTEVQKLSADLASFQNLEGGAEQASEALTKAMLGEREMVKSLGIVITEEMVKEKLLAEGKSKLTGLALQQAKAEATLKIAYEQSKNAVGDYARTSDSYANQIRQLENAFVDLKAEAGQALVDTLLPVVRELNSWVRENKDSIVNGFKDIINAVKTAGEVALFVAKGWKALYDAGAMISKEGEIRAKKEMAQIKDSFESWKYYAGNVEKLFGGTFANIAKLAVLPKEASKEAFQEMIKTWDSEKRSEEIQKKINELMVKYGYSLEDVKRITEEWKKENGLLNDSLKETGEIIGGTGGGGEGGGIKKALSRMIPEISIPDLIKKSAERAGKGSDPFEMPVIKIDAELQAKIKEKDAIEQARILAEKMRKEMEEELQLIQNIFNVGSSALGAFEKLGIISGDAEQFLGDVLSGGANLASSIATGDVFGMVSSGLDLLGTVGEKLIEVFTGDGIQEAIDRQNEWMGLTEEQNEELHQMAEEMGDVHSATSVMLNDLIDSNATIDNFNDYAIRTREILSDLDRGTLSEAEAVSELGEAFTSLVSKMEEFGMVASSEVIAIIDDMRNRGLEIPEVIDFINDGLTQASEGLELFVKTGINSQEDLNSVMNIALGTFNEMILNGSSIVEAFDMIGGTIDELEKKMQIMGLSGSEAFNELVQYQNLIEQNRDLVLGIDGLNDALEGLASIGLVRTQEAFNDFQSLAISNFDDLIGAGFDSTQALAQMAPYLKNLRDLSEEFGFTIDDNTQALIDQAEQDGLLDGMLDPMEQMVELMKVMVEGFGFALPEAFRKAGESAQDMSDRIPSDFNIPGYEPIPGDKGMPGFATGTHDMWVTQPSIFMAGEQGPELIQGRGSQMKVTPASDMGGKVVHIGQLNVTLPAGRGQLEMLLHEIDMNSDGKGRELSERLGEFN